MLAFWLASFFSFEFEQEHCAFNSVSEAEYRRLLTQAKKQNWTVWPTLSMGLFQPSNRIVGNPTPSFRSFEHGIGRRLKAYIEALVPKNANSDMKLAAAHAVLRSISAKYMDVSHVRSFSAPDRTIPATVRFTYIIPTRRFAPLCILCVLFQDTSIIVTFRVHDTPDRFIFDSVGILHEEPKYTPLKVRRASTACPAFPVVSAKLLRN